MIKDDMFSCFLHRFSRLSGRFSAVSGLGRMVSRAIGAGRQLEQQLRGGGHGDRPEEQRGRELQGEGQGGALEPQNHLFSREFKGIYDILVRL